jgi:molybdopterin molybdotransferase
MAGDRRADWLSVHDALARILARVRPTGVEVVPLRDAGGRTLAEDVPSPVDQPPWDNSGMDGYAVRAADVRGATQSQPAVLHVIETVPAGGVPHLTVATGQATRIMTGAPVPEGADGVIRDEHVAARADGTIAILDDADAGRNIRPRGEDVRAGVRALEAGRLLRPGEVGVLAMVGAADVPVRRRPRVAILSTGDELVDLDAFEEARAGRRIVNSNSYALAAAARLVGAEPALLGIARDEEQSLRTHLEAGLGADLLVTSAGASVGEHDLVKHVLETMGFSLDFWRVQMRPGSPFSFGTIARPNAEPLPVFGLPGNPVSALVTFEVLVKPALRRMLGRAAIHPPALRVRAAEPIASKTGLVHFLRVRLAPEADGRIYARLTGRQGSGVLTSMAQADALLVVPLDVEEIPEGADAWAIPLDGGDAASVLNVFSVIETG